MAIKALAALLLLSGAAAAEPIPLLCIDHGKLVVQADDGSGRDSVEPSPGARLLAIALAGRTLAAVTEESELLLAQGKRWRDLGKLTQKGGSGLLRATSDARGAHFFLAGGEDDQVAGALDVSGAGKVSFRKHPADAARVAAKSLGAIDAPEKWQALRDRLKDQIPKGVAPVEALVWAEPSPWGGALVAVATGEVEGETSVADLWFVPDTGAPVSLRYQGKPVGYRGLLGYMGDALALDGRFSAAERGTLLIRKTGAVSAVPGVDGLCIAAPR
jgi:hypothetical protein